MRITLALVGGCNITYTYRGGGDAKLYQISDRALICVVCTSNNRSGITTDLPNGSVVYSTISLPEITPLKVLVYI